jgi:hypothetical protein
MFRPSTMPNPLSTAIARVRFRKQPSVLRFALAERIDYLNAAHWDGVVAHRGFLCSRRYHRMLEGVRPDNLDPRYALLYRDDQPVAALSMQWISLEGRRLQRRPEGKGLTATAGRLKSSLVDRVSARVLVVGNLLTYGSHGISIIPGCESDADVWHAIGEAAYRVRRAEKHSGRTDFVLVKDLLPLEMRQSCILHDLGYRTIETEPNMILEMKPEWRSHDDYLAALSAKYRKNIRSRVLKPIVDAQITVVHAEDLTALAPRLHELYLAVHENAAVRPVTLGLEYWQALASAAKEGGRIRFAMLRRGAEVLGFVVTLLDCDDTAIGYHIGFDRDAARELPLYLRLLQQSIADGIALGARRVSLGRTALEPKAALGARPEPLSVWVRHRQPVLNKLMRSLLGAIHHDEAPARNPFADVRG